MEKYKDIIRKVIFLASERAKEPSLLGGETNITGVITLSAEDNPRFIELDQKLENYLESLDYETIKVIQTIMYLGRDEQYDKNLIGIERYKDYRKYMDDQIGWKTQYLEVQQIMEKLPLAKYLENGLEIIK